VENIVAFSRELGFAVRGLTFSPVKGPEGNIEYLVWLCKGRAEGNEIEASLAGEVVREAHAALDK
jgi:23S rRNA (cytidine1920-2'-O)/16S rRNA (cytidine1409-2'-O)-methyltransferase